ncbi:MAG: hypothetical protein FJ150_06360 [Euryarchaeota archaeon]|nr:hypothetical protein [Euryarchaeota archaeon]
MEKAYLYLSLMMTAALIIVFVATAALQTKVAILAVILFSLILLLFYMRNKAEKIELISLWFTLIMFIVTAALIFQKGGF